MRAQLVVVTGHSAPPFSGQSARPVQLRTAVGTRLTCLCPCSRFLMRLARTSPSERRMLTFAAVYVGTYDEATPGLATLVSSPSRVALSPCPPRLPSQAQPISFHVSPKHTLKWPHHHHHQHPHHPARVDSARDRHQRPDRDTRRRRPPGSRLPRARDGAVPVPRSVGASALRVAAPGRLARAGRGARPARARRVDVRLLRRPRRRRRVRGERLVHVARRDRRRGGRGAGGGRVHLAARRGAQRAREPGAQRRLHQLRVGRVHSRREQVGSPSGGLVERDGRLLRCPPPRAGSTASWP